MVKLQSQGTEFTGDFFITLSLFTSRILFAKEQTQCVSTIGTEFTPKLGALRYVASFLSSSNGGGASL